MTRKSLSVENLRALLDSLATNRRLIAPVRQDGVVMFRQVSGSDQVLLEYGNTAWSCKEFVFPKSEPVFCYRTRGKTVELEEPELPDQEQVIFGVRPCDAAGLLVLDAVFGWDEDDPFYAHRRQRTTIIGLACTQPGPECFCTAVGLSPTGTRGSDLLLTPIGEKAEAANGRTSESDNPHSVRSPRSSSLAVAYLVEVVTDKGERLVAEHPELFEDTHLDKDEVTRAAEAKIVRRQPLILADGTPIEELAAPVGALFESAQWEDQTRKCLQCGVCASVCPTCHCFDIVDEGNMWGGVRCRNWDSCAFALFTLHGSGHNPRPEQPTRYRQRVLHKFRYFPERFGLAMCVGCGRCAVRCPVNLDIYEVALATFRKE